jgi:hypothetical protein
MLDKDQLNELKNEGRSLYRAKTGDRRLGL